MTQYRFHRDPSGNGKGKIVPVAPEAMIKDIELSQPLTVEVGNVEKRLECDICQKRFAAPGIFSIHYNKEHRQGDDKNEWRSHAKQIVATE